MITNNRYGTVPQVRWRDHTPLIGVFLIIIGIIIVGRLFYLQIIKHEEYKNAAISEQLKKFSIPAERGTISVLDGDKEVPLVLNETRYLVYADPSFVKQPDETAIKLQSVIGGEVSQIKERLTRESRYEELAKKLDQATADKIEDLKLDGIVLKEQRFRTYPEKQFASQLLGFVNYDGEGQYGIEGYMNNVLAGTPGQLRAITDVRGVPLAGNADNIVKKPTEGQDVVLTIDSTIQRIAEEAIKKGVENTKSTNGGVVIIDVNTGAVRAMANWPSYDPGNYDQIADQNIFKNRVVTDPMEVGSIMKVLLVAAAIDKGVITKDSTYFDPGYAQVDEFRVVNALPLGAGNYTIFEIIKNSLNTGAVSVLKLMGDGEINEKARTAWYEYLTNRYLFGSQTGVEQVGEGVGEVPSPTDGYGLNIQYANTSFGQGISLTILQMAAALAAAINGGTYYQPTLIHSVIRSDGTEEIKNSVVKKSNILSASASSDIRLLMERYARENNSQAARPGFSVGGKTGTAQIPSPNGGYRDDLFNGTYAGFVGGKNPEYAIVLRIDEPRISGFAGAEAARPIFTEIANAMMNSLPFTPNN